MEACSHYQISNDHRTSVATLHLIAANPESCMSHPSNSCDSSDSWHSWSE